MRILLSGPSGHRNDMDLNTLPGIKYSFLVFDLNSHNKELKKRAIQVLNTKKKEWKKGEIVVRLD